MKRVKKTEAGKVRHLAALETELFREHLALLEHVSLLQYDDGESREPGWFTLRTSGAAWQIVVKDPDSASSFSVVAKTVDEVLATANLLLGCDEAPWEPDAYLSAQSKRKGKK